MLPRTESKRMNIDEVCLKMEDDCDGLLVQPRHLLAAASFLTLPGGVESTSPSSLSFNCSGRRKLAVVSVLDGRISTDSWIVHQRRCHLEILGELLNDVYMFQPTSAS